jgi:acyl-CoA thioester hydrolase
MAPFLLDFATIFRSGYGRGQVHRLTDSPTFRWPVRVYYEDTDAGGVVYHANYLLFMERARTEWLRALGFEQDVLRREAGVQFSVRRATIDYLRPALINNLLTVTVALTGHGGASLDLAQELVRDGDGVLCCRGSFQVACVDAATLRPARIPKQLLAEIAHGL